jgi:hypothetical protein
MTPAVEDLLALDTLDETARTVVVGSLWWYTADGQCHW